MKDKAWEVTFKNGGSRVFIGPTVKAAMIAAGYREWAIKEMVSGWKQLGEGGPLGLTAELV